MTVGDFDQFVWWLGKRHHMSGFPMMHGSFHPNQWLQAWAVQWLKRIPRARLSAHHSPVWDETDWDVLLLGRGLSSVIDLWRPEGICVASQKLVLHHSWTCTLGSKFQKRNFLEVLRREEILKLLLVPRLLTSHWLSTSQDPVHTQ